MARPLVFEKPLGMRDMLPESLVKQRQLESALRHCIEKWGYDEIVTPSLEYYDTVGAASATLESRMFKLLDKQGHTVVLRPDMTSPIARVVASLYKDVPLPIRLFYQTNVFRAQEKEAGRNAEFFQTGVELIGTESGDADAEVIALAVSCLQAAEVNAFKIAIGHVDFAGGLLEEIVSEQADRDRLWQFLQDRDYVGYRQLAGSLNITDTERRRLHALLHLRGGKEKIEEARQLTVNGKARKAVQTVVSLWEALEAYGVTEHLLLDFNLVSSLNYYTGAVFEGYAADLGSPLVTGGRYDHLLAQFGRPAPATGFAIKMDRLMQVTSIRPREITQRLAVVYPASSRQEALLEAQKLRKNGHIVITHLCESEEAANAWGRERGYEVLYVNGREERE
ncbi:ATP phosphoribosyltransferase regulatory subunit [Brevibacillus massiliensis]|jgi:ATP phosphoribosyltransferase regulatory subunit|uniref:ATP phosphoribosyltransferase regulatory subunit n=1 Tax=Brevibacillus massiliensis TaxID=1118054 RepID=UPI0002E1C6BE|nr:ATP phosphoribosyltransferase regulatory subunit [Brevibacillus massiliensis]